MSDDQGRGTGERWVVEHYDTHNDYADYPAWGPVKGGTYYATEHEAQQARDDLIDQRHQAYAAAREQDARECADRAAVYEKAAAAVAGMPQAHILGRGYRTDPIKAKDRSEWERLYRVARVTSFQERVQALLDSARGDMVDADDLRECFTESAEAQP